MTVEWYWTFVGTGVGFLAIWTLVTGMCCGSFRRDFWTPQMQWITKTITEPIRWAAGIVTSPSSLIREYWAHKERILALKKDNEAEARLSVLESVLIKGDE